MPSCQFGSWKRVFTAHGNFVIFRGKSSAISQYQTKNTVQGITSLVFAFVGITKAVERVILTILQFFTVLDNRETFLITKFVNDPRNQLIIPVESFLYSFGSKNYVLTKP